MIAGTRIPVYMLADLKAQAVNDDVLLADYPSLTQALLTQVLLYAQLHPRVGRPKQPDASWRKDASVFRLARVACPKPRAKRPRVRVPHQPNPHIRKRIRRAACLLCRRASEASRPTAFPEDPCALGSPNF